MLTQLASLRVFLAIETRGSSGTPRAGLYYFDTRGESAQLQWLMWMQDNKSTDLELKKSSTGWDNTLTYGVEAQFDAVAKGVFDDFAEPTDVSWLTSNHGNGSGQGTKYPTYIHIRDDSATARLSPTVFGRATNCIYHKGALYASAFAQLPSGSCRFPKRTPISHRWNTGLSGN